MEKYLSFDEQLCIKDDEIKLGFAITGVIDPAAAAALEKPQTGDLLVLTKPLGTGVLAFCEQVGQSHANGMAAAAVSMATLNRPAAEAMKAAGASACVESVWPRTRSWTIASGAPGSVSRRSITRILRPALAR